MARLILGLGSGFCQNLLNKFTILHEKITIKDLYLPYNKYLPCDMFYGNVWPQCSLSSMNVTRVGSVIRKSIMVIVIVHNYFDLWTCSVICVYMRMYVCMNIYKNKFTLF